MKIAYVITGLSTGGAETMLLKLLLHLDRRRFEPYVISLTTAGEMGPRIEALDIPVHTLGMQRGTLNPLKLLTLIGLLRQIEPALVHTWMYHADLLGGLSARLAGCQRVAWGLRHSNLSRTENKRTTLMVVKTCALLSGWLPTRVLSCSNRAKAVHEAVGYPGRKIHVIPNGFELDRFQPDASAQRSVRLELGLPSDTPLIGLMARYDPLKNHAGFIEAAAQVHDALPEAHFVLAGTGVDPSNVELTTAMAAHAGLSERMHCLGRRDDMPRLMAALDVLASSSHGEAFPNVLGEAMACGVPCAVTDVGDSAEIVGDTGRIVPAGDMAGLARQLLDLLRLAPAQKAALGQQARMRIATEYEISHVAGLYQAFYEQLLTVPEEDA